MTVQSPGQPDAAPRTDTRDVVIAGTFVLDVITQATSWWLGRVRTDARVVQAPYGQLLELLHDSASALRTNDGVNVVLVRPEDLLRSPYDARIAVSERATGLVDELVQALSLAPAVSGATWLVAVPPPSPRLASTPAAATWVATTTEQIARIADDTPGLHLLNLAGVPALYQVDAVHDEYGDLIGHLPYTDEYLVALGTWLARAAQSIWSKSKKAIILDCDNTLWAGVCGEDGALGVQMTPSHRYLQRFMRNQRGKGRLLCLCSRNNEADALAVFDRDDMELSLDDVTAYRIGWGAKPTAIVELADELGFALDTVVFVDDDPVECALVREQLPQVSVVEIPRDPETIPQVLAHEWIFDQFVVTEDDLLRADRYTQESRRREALARSDDYAEFLRRCQTEIRIEPLDEGSLERAAQLTSRTTQFNLTGEPFSMADLRTFLSEGDGWTVRVSDRFGDYGTVGLILANAAGTGDDSALHVRLLLMSCRVLNRGVEQEMVRFLIDRATAAGCAAVELPYRETNRNTPARLFLERLSGGAVPAPSGVVTVEVTAASAPV